MMRMYYVILSVLVLLPRTMMVQAGDFLYAVGRSPTTNAMNLFRIGDAGFGTVVDMGQIRINLGTTPAGPFFTGNFDVSGAAFDYKNSIRPAGDLFILTGENSGAVSNKVLLLDNALSLVPPVNPAIPAFVDVTLFADAGEYSVGLAITDENNSAQRLFTWRIGENEAFPEDDLIELIPRTAGSVLFPTPRQTNLNNGIVHTSNQLIGYDVIRNEKDDQIVHIVYFDKDTNKHSYFRFNLRTTESEWVSTNIVLNERQDRCYLGSMNPNVPGEFWCIRKQIDRSSQQELVRINLKGNPDPIEVLDGSRTLPISDIAAIAFSYQTTQAPSSKPSKMPSRRPSSRPSRRPSSRPSTRPSRRPSSRPSRRPSRRPSARPSRIPSELPSTRPSRKPSRRPSGNPTEKPSGLKSAIPSERPSRKPSKMPSRRPSGRPSGRPSRRPSKQPSRRPSAKPSKSLQPSRRPSRIPSETPSRRPSRRPSVRPSVDPTSRPSKAPSKTPSRRPSARPSKQPSKTPSKAPSRRPSSTPSRRPSKMPSRRPSAQPSNRNRCDINTCSFFGIPGAQMSINSIFGCSTSCVGPEAVEGLFLALGFRCGKCPIPP